MKSHNDMHPERALFSEYNVQLEMETEWLKFQFIKDTEVKQEIALRVGYRLITNRFFKHEIPTFDETDYAINYIEDALMSDKTLLQSNKELITSDDKIITLFRKNKISGYAITRRSVEDLFSQYARVVMGAPVSTLEAGITAEDFAILLILREIMHHLDFEVLKFNG